MRGRETLVAPFLDGRVRRIDLKSGLELDAIEVRATRVAVDPNGRWLVTTEKGGTEARVWDISARRLLHVLPAYTLGKYPQVCEASFRCDGARLVTWSKDSSPRVWDTEFGRLVGELTIHAGVKVPGLCLGVAWSPDGARIATSELFGDVRTWLVGDVVREERTYPGTRSATCVAFSADGTRLVTDDEGPHAVVWDVATGERLGRSRSKTSTGTTAPPCGGPSSRATANASPRRSRMVEPCACSTSPAARS